MSRILSAAQMRAVENAAISSGEVTGAGLMERAGEVVVGAILAELAAQKHDIGAAAGRALIFCGPGNNGGDGFVIARLLHLLGWQIELRFHGRPERLPPDARLNHDRWLALGAVLPFEGFSPWDAPCDLVVDALYGIGLARPVAGPVAAILSQITAAASQARRLSVAVDLPSGLCADSGRLLGEAPEVDLTVTFGFFKPAHFLAEGPERCGRLLCCDIGLDRTLPHRLFARPEARAEGPGQVYRDLLWLEDGRSLQPGFSDRRSRLDKGWLSHGTHKFGAHKFGHGHAFVLGGPSGRGGAARLSARAALRIGAGLVTLGCPEAALAENAARLDEIMLCLVADETAVSEILEDRRITALCIGPGFGTGAREAGMLRAALAAARPVILDADALTLLAQEADLLSALHKDCVLTPHGGEFARLFPDIAARLVATPQSGPAPSKIDAVREAALRAGCTVVLKGMDTVIAEPSGRAAISSAAYGREAPWLATAGSGDVLAGIIAGLIARGFPVFEAASIGPWLHVEAARAFGPGLIAGDLPQMLPQVMRVIASWTEPVADFGMPPAGVF